MKKMISLLTAISLLFSIVSQLTVFADNTQNYKKKYPDYYDAMVEAVEYLYIYPYAPGTQWGHYGNYGMTFQDDGIKYSEDFDNSTIARGLWQDFSLPKESEAAKRISGDNVFNIVYERDVLADVLKFKFNIELDDLIEHDMPTMTYMDDSYIVFRSYNTGETYPETEVVVDSVTELDDKHAYCSWHIEDIHNRSETSSEIYGILERGSVNGVDTVGYRYLSLSPTSSSVIPVKEETHGSTQWETGEYAPVLTIGDYIYYIGKNPNFNNQDVGAGTYYAIWVYNQKTRQEKMILEAASNLQHIGNKLYAVSGLNPSGSQYRNLYCFDLDGSNPKHITSGLKVEVAYGEEPFTIYGDRLYFGYDENQDYCGVKSCTLDGDDIRIEVNPIYAPNRRIELHENYAVIDKMVCYYNFSSSEKITVMIDGVEVQFDQPPIIYNDRTLVPLRAIFEAFGAEVTWDGETQTVTAVRGKITIKLTIGAYEFYKNDEKIELDVPGIIINDRTLVPVRAISESFNCVVSWSDYDKTVFIYQRTDNSNIFETFEYDSQIEEAINIVDSSNGAVSDEELQILFDCVGIANVEDYFDDISVYDVSRTDKSALDFWFRVNDYDYSNKLEAYMSAIEQVYGERHSSPMVGDISWAFGEGEKYIFLTYEVKEHRLYISWSNEYFFNRSYYMQEKTNKT